MGSPPSHVDYQPPAAPDLYLNDPSPGYRASGPVTPLGETTGRKEYQVIDQAHYAPNEIYKAGDHDDCHYVDKVVYKDQCIPYVEKTCYTQQEEICEDVFEKNCTAVIDDTDERECFEVTELICQLSETIDYNVVQETYTVLRCTRTSERVCDTIYDLAISTKDDFQCIDVNYNYCWDEQKVVKDRTCTFSVDFECGKPQKKMARTVSTVTRCRPKNATTRHVPSVKRFASRASANTVKNSPTSSLCRSRSRTATASRSNGARWRSASDRRRRGSMSTTRSAGRSRGRSAKTAKRKSCAKIAGKCSETFAAISPKNIVSRKKRNTASRTSLFCMKKFVCPKEKLLSMKRLVMFNCYGKNKLCTQK